MKANYVFLMLILWSALHLSGCSPQGVQAGQAQPGVTVEFTLRTSMADGRMVFIGVGGEIDGAVNPDLHVHPGDHVRLVLENGDGMPHDVAIPDLYAQVPMVSNQGDQAEVIFEVGEDRLGTFPYFCTVIGHRQAGMEGKLVVGNEAE